MSEHGVMPVATTGTSTEDWGEKGGYGIRALKKTSLSDYTNADHRRLNNPQETGHVLPQRDQQYLGVTEGRESSAGCGVTSNWLGGTLGDVHEVGR